MMKIEAYISDEKSLAEDVHRFWDLNTVGIRDDESSVLENFMDSITFGNGRFKIELPFYK